MFLDMGLGNREKKRIWFGKALECFDDVLEGFLHIKNGYNLI